MREREGKRAGAVSSVVGKPKDFVVRQSTFRPSFFPHRIIILLSLVSASTPNPPSPSPFPLLPSSLPPHTSPFPQQMMEQLHDPQPFPSFKGMATSRDSPNPLRPYYIPP